MRRAAHELRARGSKIDLIASVEPVQTIHAYEDTATLYYELKPAMEVLEATRLS